MPVVLLATSNKHKVEEIRAILGGKFEFLTLSDFPNAPRVIEDAPDFAGNAAKKSVTLASWLAEQPARRRIDFVLADDSGLEVDALQGAPGVHSARFAALDSGKEGNSPDSENNAKLLRLLEKVPEEQRTARFRCVLALTPVVPRGTASASPVCSVSEMEFQTEVFHGVCEGRILARPAGARGFGYDPLFVPAGFSQSFAELGDAVKNQISHRSAALRKLAGRFA